MIRHEPFEKINFELLIKEFRINSQECFILYLNDVWKVSFVNYNRILLLGVIKKKKGLTN
jgi:hypothetical protein